MKSGMHPSSTVTVLPQGATSALLCLLRYRLATQNISNLICGGELGSAAVADSFEVQRGSKPRTSSPVPDASRPKLSGVHEIRRYGRKRQLNAEGPLNATCANRQANGGARDYGGCERVKWTDTNRSGVYSLGGVGISPAEH